MLASACRCATWLNVRVHSASLGGLVLFLERQVGRAENVKKTGGHIRKHTSQNLASISQVTSFGLILVSCMAFISGLILAPYLELAVQAASTSQTSPIDLTTVQPTHASGAMMADDILAIYGDALTNIYEQTVPAVVKLDITPIASHGPSDDRYGSGLVWDNAGQIVTNFHLLHDAQKIAVTFADGTRRRAEALGSHPLADLAVLKVARPPAELQPATLGDSSALKVGQLTLAIGAPFGQEFTMTRGIISGLGRTIRPCQGCYPVSEAIQTDTPLNPGNSGGPLLNQNGAVIGINTTILSQSGANAGVGFAISIELVEQIVPSLIHQDRLK